MKVLLKLLEYLIMYKLSLLWKVELLYLWYWFKARGKRKVLIHGTQLETPWNSCILTLTPFVHMELLSGILRYAQGLFKCHQGNNKVTHMKQALCVILYEKHWIKSLHNKLSAYERQWTVGEPNWKQCWIWFLPPLITY